ncbi:metallophosphoesterase [Actinomadura chibensis]|uniref:Phosphodiesterase n=1 Tax=Actinomadura chibensis TaxID=392828 RepID=A0A5D0NAT3_9ACTN|nr:metallophosphoesterase [Actinomadura chibensis]TYB41554.1 phosphodiesterase [Actinomadura chibensis]
MLVFAQLSDTHLDGGGHRAERTARVMAHLDGLPLDAVLVTGDIADHGEPAEYEQAVKALASRHPVLMCPGNHDARGPYRAALLGEPPSGDPVDRAHTVAGALFAMCDSTIPGRPGGFLADETLTWLDERLAADPGAPAFVCFHHPPVRVGIPYVDGIRQSGEERLAAVIERHPRVVAVLCGHAHTAAATTFAGRPLLVAPGVVSTLRLPGEAGDVADETAPPGFALHILDGGGRLTTHYRTL